MKRLLLLLLALVILTGCTTTLSLDQYMYEAGILANKAVNVVNAAADGYTPFGQAATRLQAIRAELSMLEPPPEAVWIHAGHEAVIVAYIMSCRSANQGDFMSANLYMEQAAWYTDNLVSLIMALDD